MQKCKVCDSTEVYLDEFDIYVCQNCGSIQDMILVENKSSRDISHHHEKQIYTRMSHFREFLNHIQGLENTKIDNEIIDQLRNKLKNNEFSKKIIRQNIPNRYKRNIVKIMFLAFDIEPIRIHNKDRTKFEAMFKQIEICSRDFKMKHFIDLKYIFYQL